MPSPRLSDAVIRGFGKLTPNSQQFLTWFTNDDSIPCGCALGAALLDCVGEETAKQRSISRASWSMYSRKRIIEDLQQYFPWFEACHEDVISEWFGSYAYKRISFTDLITRIRHLEEPFIHAEEENDAPCRESAKTEVTQDQSYLITA